MRKPASAAQPTLIWCLRLTPILLILALILLLILPGSARSAGLPLLNDGSGTPTLTATQTDAGITVTPAQSETPAITDTAAPTFTETPNPPTPFDLTATQRFATAVARHLNDPYFGTATAMAASATPANVRSLGSLVDDSPDHITVSRAFIYARNTIMSARFYNDSGRHGYYGFLFRDQMKNMQYRIFLNYYQQWQFGYGQNTMASGYSPWIDTSPTGYNDMMVVVKDKAALLFINGNFVYILTLDNKNDTGDVAVFAGVYLGAKASHQSTIFTDFRVWILP